MIEKLEKWLLYKYDRKTGKVVAGSITLHTTIYQTLFVCLQTTFLLEDVVPE